MTVYYRDSIGIVAETLSDGETGSTIDICDGYAYYTSAKTDEDGDCIERKIPLSAIIRIER